MTVAKQSGYKAYRSVTEFPLHLDKLDRSGLEEHYLDLRSTYGSLTKSRGQLVRRQTEAKAKVAELQKSLKQLNAAIARAQEEKQTLQASLAHNEKARRQIQNWGNNLAEELDDVNAKMAATTQVLGEFEEVYEQLQGDQGVLSIGKRFALLMRAVRKLLTTDINELIQQQRLEEAGSDRWDDDTAASNNRSLHDGSA